MDTAATETDPGLSAKLEELRAKHPGEELHILADRKGRFTGIFATPTQDVWKMLLRESANPETKVTADNNLVVRCLRWPGVPEFQEAARRRPILTAKLGAVLAELAGADLEIEVKKA